MTHPSSPLKVINIKIDTPLSSLKRSSLIFNMQELTWYEYAMKVNDE